jgi:prepilin-type processing-associated H-X9-DG protein
MAGKRQRRRDRLCDAAQRCQRAGITILELLVVMVVVGLLAALLLPAVARARESARRLQCSHRLRQIGIACQAHQDALGRLPMGWRETAAQPTGWGWGARLLDYLEQSSTCQAIQLEMPVDHPLHEQVRRHSLPVFRCPSDHLPEVFLLMAGGEEEEEEEQLEDAGPAYPLYDLAGANFVGVFGMRIPDESPPDSGEGAFLGNRSFRLEDLRQGTSNTLLVGERTGWLLPSTWVGMDLRNHEGPGRIVGSTLHAPNDSAADECEFSSRHDGGAQFAFADGHVEMVSGSISLPVYHRMSSRYACQ